MLLKKAHAEASSFETRALPAPQDEEYARVCLTLRRAARLVSKGLFAFFSSLLEVLLNIEISIHREGKGSR